MLKGIGFEVTKAAVPWDYSSIVILFLTALTLWGLFAKRFWPHIAAGMLSAVVLNIAARAAIVPLPPLVHNGWAFLCFFYAAFAAVNVLCASALVGHVPASKGRQRRD